MAAKLMGRGFSFVLAIVLARVLSTSGRGMVAMASQLAAIGALLGGLGLPGALQVSLSRKSHETFNRTSVEKQSLLALACAGIGVSLSLHLLFPGMTVLLLVGAGVYTVVTGYWDILRGALSGYGLQDRAAMVGISQTAFVVCALTGIGWTSVDVTPAIVLVILSVTSVIPVLRLRRLGDQVCPGRGVPVTVGIAFCVRWAFAQGLLLLLYRADLLTLGVLNGPAQAGEYAVALAVGEIPQVIAAAAGALLPGEVGSADESRQHAAERVARMSVILTTACSLALALVVAPLIPLIFGEAYRAAVAPAILLLVFSPSLTLGRLLASQRYGYGDTTTLRNAALFGSIAEVGGVVLFAQAWGVTGAAVASVLAYGLFCAIMFWKDSSAGRRLIPGAADVEYVARQLPTVAIERIRGRR